MLYESSRHDLADMVSNIVSGYRRELELLEESYIESSYGEAELLENQGKACVEAARKMLEVLRRIEVELAGQAVERLKLLKRWREFSLTIARAAKEMLGDPLEAVYVVGSVAENKVTVYSDIDVAIVVDDVKLKSLETVIDIELKAEDLGLSLEAPVDIKMLTEEFKNSLGKHYMKVVKVYNHNLTG